jgi:type I restriction enzyme S subunit
MTSTSSENRLSNQMRQYERAKSIVFLKTKEAFGGLSNMAGGFPLRVSGVRIYSAEALYQACRFPHMPDVQRSILGEPSPMTAKMRGKPYRSNSRPDWDQVRVRIMRWCLRVKLVQHWNAFGDLLLSTDDKSIVEASHKDDFWGAKPVDTDSLVGMNVLGRLLMELREELKSDRRDALLRLEPLAIPDFVLLGQPIPVIEAFSVESKRTQYSSNPLLQPSLFVEDVRASGIYATTQDSISASLPSISANGGLSKQADPVMPDLKPYTEYKESGLPWLGQVPGHWGQRRMKFLFAERVQKGFPDEPLLAATQSKGVVRKEDYGSRTVTATKDFHLLKLVEQGDFVISLRSFEGGLEVAHCRGIISPAYTILKPRREAKEGYYARFFKSADFISSLTLFVTGIREGQNIDYERLSRAYMPLPPAEEQIAIGRFLGWANGRLERAIRAKRKVIALLGEQKQAIIHRAVTGGLDPSVPLKPSGIPWFGDIPQHWDFRAFARLARVVRGASPRPAGDKRYFYGTHIAWLTVGEVTKDSEIYLTKTETFLTKLGEEHSVRFPLGTLVLTNSGATLGVPKILAIDVCANDGIVAFLRLNPVVDPVFAYCYLSTLTKRLRDELRQGGTQPNLNTGIVRSIACPLPPKAEQEAILEFLDSELAGIRTAISRLEREIELLREYRTRLVADVVTGKLDVREAAARLPDEAPLDAAEDDADLDMDTEVADEEAVA